MKKISILLICLLIPWGTKAHQPNLSSTILAEQESNSWVLQIRAALTAFEFEVENYFGRSSYSSPEEFNDLLIKYIQKHVQVQFNQDAPVLLEKGIVKLGHETSVTFEIKGTPEDIRSLFVQNNSFADISRNHSALIVVKQGIAKRQFILNNDNRHAASLAINGSKLELTKSGGGIRYYPHLILILIGLAMPIVFFLYKDKRASRLAIIPLDL